ncbi:MAG: 2-dehydropantoate 2-reductase [Glaciecola sp.]|nr:2-dehydropantoate 2-reductase [Glaciecola sp.]MDG1814696.1 2-dehydropantoate 2-reductase [Glaciecola sp.]MDG2100390.1 2-dehydropantoate 2-reductase [Glaciecola sp.]
MHVEHAIVGAGLIGGYLAAHLADITMRLHPDARVLVVGRAYAKSQFSTQMTISDFATPPHIRDTRNIDFVSDINAWASPERYPNVVWLTVKCTAIEQVVADITPLIGPHTVIVCCQNGIGSDAVVRQAFANNLVLRCMFPFNVVQLKGGHFHRGSSGIVMFEQPLQGDFHHRFTPVIDALNAQYGSVFPCAWNAQMDALLWAKCQVNLTNSVNALANLSLKDTLLDKGYRKIIALMMQEHLAVCKAQGITLPKITKVDAKFIPTVLTLPNWLFSRVAKSMVDIDPHAKLSMWWDLEQGRATEIDYINGATINAGQRLGVATPMNNKVFASIKTLEQAPARYAISAQDLLK